MDAEQGLEAVHHGSNPRSRSFDADNARGASGPWPTACA